MVAILLLSPPPLRGNDFDSPLGMTVREELSLCLSLSLSYSPKLTKTKGLGFPSLVGFLRAIFQDSLDHLMHSHEAHLGVRGHARSLLW